MMDKMIDLINQGGSGEYDARQERGEAVALYGIKNGVLLEPDDLKFLAEMTGHTEGADPDEYGGIVLWVGETVDQDGDEEKRYYGLNFYYDECPEEGSICIKEMPRSVAHPTPDAGRVAELEQKLSDQRRISVELNDQCVDYCRRIAALESQLAESMEREGRMREALTVYGVHSINCVNDDNRCICGFDAVLDYALAADKEQTK